MNASHDDLIRTGEAAAILGTSRQHVLDLCQQGVLSFERYRTHRRLRRADVELLAATGPKAPVLNRDQRQSVWLHGAVASELVASPERTIRRARTNLRRLREIHPTGMSARRLEDWVTILGQGHESILETLTSRRPAAIELRQNSPFAGVISDARRQAILSAFRASERATVHDT